MNFIVKIFVWFGIQCEVKRGTKRIVLIFPEYGFALKFAIFQPISLLYLLWRMRRNRISWIYTLISRGGTVNMLVPGNIEGFLENWREYRFFKRHPSPFLFPVHFSLLGIVNVSPIKDQLPDDIDYEKLRIIFNKAIPTNNEDAHHFKNPENFCFRDGHLCMTDYGSSLTQEVIRQHWNTLQTLTEELVRNH